MIEDPQGLAQLVLRRSGIIFGLGAIPLLIFQEFRMVLGLLSGASLALLNFTLLKLPLEPIMKRSSKKMLVLTILSFFGRFAFVALGIFLLVRLRFLNVAGIFLGVAIPILAISSILVFKEPLKWRV